jgi:glycosyltransferase involved in cell wall biosynthesis
VICLSTQYWGERRFRKHEFMSRLARTNRVLFVEPSFSMARAPEPHVRHVAANRLLVPRLRRLDAHLHLLQPPRGLPKWSDRRIERLTYAWYARLVERAARSLGFREPVLWVYAPAYANAVGTITHRDLVFDLVDDLAAYGGDAAADTSHVADAVERLVRSCDLLVVSALTLLDRYEQIARRSVHVANGYDASAFSGARPAEDPLPGVSRPVVGFVGTIFKYLDLPLLEAVASRNRDKSFVLVGPVESSVQAELARLASQPNVIHVGPTPQAEVPRWLDAFDVCLNPFRRGRLSDSVNPLKVYEYLAAGKPVVSTPMAALAREPAAELVEFADGVEEFSAAIARCLAAPGELAAARREAAAPYSWDNLFARLDEALDDALSS